MMGKFHTLDLQPIGVPAADIVVILRPELIAEVIKRTAPWKLRFKHHGLWNLLEGISIDTEEKNEEAVKVARKVTNALKQEIQTRATERAVQMGKKDSYMVSLGPEDLNLKILDEAIAQAKQEYRQELEGREREEREKRKREEAIEYVCRLVREMGGEFECGLYYTYGTVKLAGIVWEIENRPEILRELTPQMIFLRTLNELNNTMKNLQKEIENLKLENKQKNEENKRLRELSEIARIILSESEEDDC